MTSCKKMDVPHFDDYHEKRRASKPPISCITKVQIGCMTCGFSLNFEQFHMVEGGSDGSKVFSMGGLTIVSFASEVSKQNNAVMTDARSLCTGEEDEFAFGRFARRYGA